MMPTLLFLVLFVSACSFSSAQFEGFGGREPKFCPPYRCKKDEEPVPKWPLKLDSSGCSGMGGMQIFSPGLSSSGSPQEVCCDLRNACLQTCGASKTFCDEEFIQCGKTACDNNVMDAEEKKSCESSASMNQILVQLDNNCQKYDAAQHSHCECVPSAQAADRRERVLRAFYKKFSPEAVDKVPGLAAKADTPAKMVGLLLRLYKKYPSVIQKVKDPQQEAMEKLMKDAGNRANSNEDEETESDAEDLGTDEL